MAHTNDGERVIRRTHPDPPKTSSPKASACSCGQPSNANGARCTRCASKMCLACHSDMDRHGYCPQCQRAPADFGEPREPQAGFPGSDYLSGNRGPRSR
jgi:hypothetical protein